MGTAHSKEPIGNHGTVLRTAQIQSDVYEMQARVGTLRSVQHVEFAASYGELHTCRSFR